MTDPRRCARTSTRPSPAHGRSGSSARSGTICPRPDHRPSPGPSRTPGRRPRFVAWRPPWAIRPVRTLRNVLQEAGLPGPGRILLWGRLLLAGARLGDDRRRIEDVAFSLGYATATSFARAMKVHTGLTPAAVSERGGMEAVLARLISSESPSGGSGSGGTRALMSALVASGLVLTTAGCAALGAG
ncbi:MAG: helix-turn-helix domain-containing protein, partial [Gemmatimonadetes bacterium]|nr:helix-turn-helix transcriptional regulator [Actinomycetota bacterium]NIY07061.1 helix-turn-helix domain-containing protein [Gemmatimonadota bacterium]NIS28814.1 helix-turn-helix transcriptional regulator [Actinomycetota bacterium]NIT94176.1 helix-turn-helix transcriptional regulator [Actinomycetota bacterium]NIU64254.1 helix-turn-helix transcriptional regulator [Actinomycetota bacterium]